MLPFGKNKLFKNTDSLPLLHLNWVRAGWGEGAPSYYLQILFTPYNYKLLSILQKKKFLISTDFSKHSMVHGAGNHNFTKEKISLRG